jgi:methylase of polypeptide subunit release factors
VLIPRPETEYWATRLSERLLDHPNRQYNILDLCTGSACVPLLLCAVLPKGKARALGVDISDEACALARENAELLDLAPPIPFLSILDADLDDEDQISGNYLDILQLDIFNHPGRLFTKTYDVITCNPPYIPYAEYLTLSTSVKSFEDPKALVGDPLSLHYRNTTEATSHQNQQSGALREGLSFYYLLADYLLPRLLSPTDGICAIEVGKGQAQRVHSLLETTGIFKSTEIWQDPWGIDRTIIGIT